MVGQRPVTWINVEGLGDARTIEQFGELFGLHRLALEDTVNLHQRAKVENYGEVLFKLGRYDDAIAAWTRALAGDGTDIDRADSDRKIKTAKQKLPKKQ